MRNSPPSKEPEKPLVITEPLGQQEASIPKKPMYLIRKELVDEDFRKGIKYEIGQVVMHLNELCVEYELESYNKAHAEAEKK